MYKVVAGDTFEIISRKIYKTESKAELLKKANPNTTEPLTEGTSLITPSDITAPTNRDLNIEASSDEVVVLINDKRFRFFNDISINKSIDNLDTIVFNAPMESQNKDFRDIFKPFTYKNIIVYVGSSKLFDGTILNISPAITPENKIVTIDAYSRAGVLNDCTATSSQYPIEYNDMKLEEIVNNLVAPFGIKAIFSVDSGAKFERVSLAPSKKIFTFLMDLAKQRNLLITSEKDGNLLFQKVTDTNIIEAKLQQGISPVIGVSSIFAPQEYYSHITGIEPIMIGLDGSSFTVKNTLVENTLRPLVFSVEDTQNADMEKAVNSKIGRMFGNMISYTIEVNTWRTSKKELWQPNTFIRLRADDSMIYTSYLFLIRSVVFNKTPNSKTAILNIVLPESFTGGIPKGLPWDE